MIQDARWQMPQIVRSLSLPSSFSPSPLSLSIPLSSFLTHSLLDSSHTVAAALLLTALLPLFPLFFLPRHNMSSVSHVSAHNSRFLSFFLTVSPSVPPPKPPPLPATVANLITHQFTGGRGEVNRGDKEGKDRSSEEGKVAGVRRRERRLDVGR